MAHIEPSRYNRISRQLIHPCVFVGKYNMGEFERLQLIPAFLTILLLFIVL